MSKSTFFDSAFSSLHIFGKIKLFNTKLKNQMTVSVEFIQGLNEKITEVSLRKRRNSDIKIVVLIFDRLQATESFRSFTNTINTLWLKDEEGNIQVAPSGIKFLSADESDFSKVECSFEVESEENFERVMRFLHRYAEANGFEFKSN